MGGQLVGNFRTYRVGGRCKIRGHKRTEPWCLEDPNQRVILTPLWLNKRKETIGQNRCFQQNEKNRNGQQGGKNESVY